VTEGRDSQRLRSLGRGMPLDGILAQDGWQMTDLETWWAAELQRRLPDPDGALTIAGLGAEVEIVRDERGLPHVFAPSDDDLFVGYGYAQAQDRLFQLDMQRRKGRGTLAALIGADGLEWDRVAATFDFEEVLARHLASLDAETEKLLEAFAMGIEAAARAGPLPIEYGLLGADWEPWRVVDSLACALAWRWQFTGRPHVVTVPEVLRRRLGDESLLAAVLASQREVDAAILPPDAPRPPGGPAEAQRIAAAGPAGPEPRRSEAPGSNDWAIAGWRSASGSPLLASDPHMPYQHVSAFHEAGLHGGSFDAVGAGLVGMGGLLFGRNRHLAWGMTNNICSQRDLYQERRAGGTAEEAEAFEYDGLAEQAQRREASIVVRDAEPVRMTVLRTRNGPIVDALLHPSAASTGPVSMRWLGNEVCELPAALLRITRAGTVAGAMAACEGWLVPTFSMVFADVSGSIGYLATGRIPLRAAPERGYRPGWDPLHQWQGLVPAEGMPRSVDPARGWLASANNRPAPEDWPYPLSGTFDEAYRYRRIGSLIEAGSVEGRRLDLGDVAGMHADVRSLRAVELRAAVLALMDPLAGREQRPVLDAIRDWDGESSTGSAGAAAWNVLFTRWAQAVMAERIADRDLADYLSAWGLGLAARLIRGDDIGWFAPGRRAAVARAVLQEAFTELTAALGADPAGWTWGRLHKLRLPHTLSGRGDLRSLLDKGPVEVPGDLTTLNNSGYDASRPVQGRLGESRAWWATSGAGYRLEVDLGQDPPLAWTITLESQSGRPGSAHYDDQREDFLAGRTRPLPLDRAEVERMARHRTRLGPGGPS
jgi:penicillin G amidase